MEAQDILSGRYRLERPLGQGGMSVVWRAHDQVLGRAVAVKVLAGRYVEDQVFRTAIQREAKAAARLSHPHVANVYDYGESVEGDRQPVPFVVMELLAGRSLAERIAESSIAPRTALRVCAQVAGALAAAHANGVVHRDMKPGNIMLTAAGAKVFDFGISALVGAPDTADQQGRIFGTLTYMAPERLVDGAVLAASDVYALGLLLYRLLTDRLPPWAGDPVAFLTRPDPQTIKPLPEIEAVPASVSELYQRCVARDPAQRPTAREATLVLAAAAGVRAPLGESSTDLEDDSTNLTYAVEKALTTVATVRGAGRHWKRVAVGICILLVGAAAAAGLTGAWRGSTPAAGAPAASSPGVNVEAGGQSGASVTPAGADPSGPGRTGVPVPNSTSGPATTTSAPAVPGVGTPRVDPTPNPTAAPTTPSAPTKFTSVAGTIVVTCANVQAELLSWTPADGYTVKRYVQSSADKVRVVFKKDSATPVIVAMIVSCPNNEPKLVIKDNDT